MTVKRVGDFICKDNPFRMIRDKEDYSYHYGNIETGKQLRATLRAGEFAWPGGYPVYLFCDDGQPLCFGCAKDNIHQVTHSVRHGLNDGWRIIGCDVNWEDPDMHCDHCEKHIESAYGGDDE